MVTLTLSSAVGSLPLMKSAVTQGRVVAERFAPKIETQAPGAMAAPRLAALTTPFGEMTGTTGGF